MVPIPSPGWYCNRTSAIYTARDTYYGISFAPDGRYDGHVPDPTAGTPGHPGYFVQADIDAEALVPDSFNVSVTNAWNATYDSVVATVTVKCVTNWSGTTPYLRAALVQTNDFATSPGSNGEMHFENVVQAMYPDATGTTIPATWTAGTTNTYVIKGAVPNWVDKAGAPYMVVWLQDDANKVIQQAAKSTGLPSIPLDVAPTAVASPSGLVCATSPGSLTHTVTLKNPGLSGTLTSAQLYYKIDAGSYTNYSWSGSLAPGASASVSVPAISLTFTASGYHTIIDSVALPNGGADLNPANNVIGTSFYMESNAGLTLPFATSFETSDPAYYKTDNLKDGHTWGTWQTGTSALLGHTGTYAAGYPFFDFPAGESNTLVLPKVVLYTPAKENISFWVAYSQQNTSNTDKLELVYSPDCGVTWNSAWSMSGSAMVTLPANTSAYSYPTSPSQYKNYVVNLGSVPASGTAMLGFRATQGGGNFVFVDDINIVTTEGVENISTATSTDINIYPNPSKNEATLTFKLTNESDVQVQISDVSGRMIGVLANGKMDAGAHSFPINTNALPNGVYNVTIHTDGGTFNQRLTVVQ